MRSVYADFNQKVAEVIGWKFEPRPDAFNDGECGYRVLNPKGEQQYWYHEAAKCYMGVWPASIFENSYPDFMHKPELALTLTVEGWELQLWERNEPPGKWFAHYFNDSNVNVATGWSDNPAEAICIARLALAEHIQWLASLPKLKYLGD